MSWLRKLFGLGRSTKVPFKLVFTRFRQLIDSNTRVLQLLTDAAEKQGGEYVFDRTYVVSVVEQLFDLADKIVYDLNSIADQKHARLYALVDQLRAEALGDLSGRPVVPRTDACVPFDQIDESRVNLVGGKSAHLGEVMTRLQVPIPAGFAISTHAYLRIVEENGLAQPIETAIERLNLGDRKPFDAVCERLRSAKIPRDVRRSIFRALSGLKPSDRPLYVALRSSALGEDDEESFAGQYRSLLQVTPEGVLDAYREVLASLYESSALDYRQARGLPAFGLMAVACMRMVEASTAGVLYTVDPNRADSGRMLLSATRGLASRALTGGQSLSMYELSRDAPHAVLAYSAAPAKEQVVGRPDGGTEIVTTPRANGGARELTEAEAARLAEIGTRIERYFKQPQEIEWARDADGTLYVLQTRRLKLAAASAPARDLPELLRHYPVIMRACGHVACRGVASGRAYVVTSDADLDGMPTGAILVARRASPRFVRVMPRVSAILTDIGAPTGHMAALAREFRVPTIVDCGDATTCVGSGQEVTVDADDGVVYAGRVEGLLQHQLVEETGFEDAPEYRLLRRLLRRVTPLQLVDPASDDFRAERCHTLHDVVRFAHEKAVEELIGLHESGRVFGAEAARRVDSELPLNLRVIDIGGGIDGSALAQSPGKPVKPEAIRSTPMRAMWAGLTTPGVWNTRPVGVDLRTFMTSAMSPGASERGGRNLAVVSEAYANLSLNLGYHYTMVDAYLSDDRDANHVYFRFVGGASDRERRVRRATMVREILERLDFSARQNADLVTGRLRKLPRPETVGRLESIGRLIGFTRQIDAVMNSEEEVARYVDAFLRGDYALD
jgi:pyruvate,water dikinase